MPPQQAAGQLKVILPALSSLAKELRHSDTLAEKLAWRLLRNRQLLRYKFRRQVPLGAIIVDFCCLSLKLVIELDGTGHAYASQEKSDRQRDAELEKKGYRVLRFPNGIVLKAPTEFVKKVGECIADLERSRLEELRSEASFSRNVRYPPHPDPSPALGRGEPKWLV